MRKVRSKSHQVGFSSIDPPLPRIESGEPQSAVADIVKELHDAHFNSTLKVVREICCCDSEDREAAIKKFSTKIRKNPVGEHLVHDLQQLLRQTATKTSFESEAKILELKNQVSALRTSLPSMAKSLQELRNTCRLVSWQVKYLSEVEPFKIWIKITRWIANYRLSELEKQQMTQHDPIPEPELESSSNHLAALNMCKPLLETQKELHQTQRELERYTRPHSDDEQEQIKHDHFSKLHSKVAVVMKALKVTKTPGHQPLLESVDELNHSDVTKRRFKRAASLFQTDISQPLAGLPAIPHKRKSFLRRVSLFRKSPVPNYSPLDSTGNSNCGTATEIDNHVEDLLTTMSTIKQQSVGQIQRITGLRTQVHQLRKQLKTQKETALQNEASLRVDTSKPPPTGLSASKLEKRLFAALAELASLREELLQERDLNSAGKKISAENVSLKSEVEKLSLDLQREKSHLLSLSSRFAEQQGRLDRVTSDRLEVQDQSEHLERIIDSLENRNNLLVAEIASAQKRSAEHRSAADDAASKIFDLQEKLIEGFPTPLPYSEDYHNEIHRLKRIILVAEDDGKVQATHNSMLQDRLHAADLERKKLSAAVLSVKKSLSESEHRAENADDLVQALKNELQAKTLHYQHSQESLKKTEGKYRDLVRKIGGADAANYIEKLEEATARQISSTRGMLAEAEKDNKQLSSKNTELMEAVERLTRKADDQCRFNENQKEEVSQGKKQLSLLERRVSELTFNAITNTTSPSSLMNVNTSIANTPIEEPSLLPNVPVNPSSLSLPPAKSREMTSLIQDLMSRCREAEQQLAEKDAHLVHNPIPNSSEMADLLSDMLARCEAAEEKYESLVKRGSPTSLSNRVMELEAVLGGSDSVVNYSYDATILLSRLHESEIKNYPPSDLLERCHAAEQHVARLEVAVSDNGGLSDQKTLQRRREVAQMLRSFQRRCHAAETTIQKLVPESEQRRQNYLQSTTVIDELNISIRSLEEKIADRDLELADQGSLVTSQHSQLLGNKCKVSSLELLLQYQTVQFSVFCDQFVPATFNGIFSCQPLKVIYPTPAEAVCDNKNPELTSQTLSCGVAAAVTLVVVCRVREELCFELFIKHQQRSNSIFDVLVTSPRVSKTAGINFMTTMTVAASSNENNKPESLDIVPILNSTVALNGKSDCYDSHCINQRSKLKDRLTIALCRVHELELLLSIATDMSKQGKLLGQFSVIEKDGFLLTAPPPSPEVENSKRILLKELEMVSQGATLSTAKFNKIPIPETQSGRYCNSVIVTCVGAVVSYCVNLKIESQLSKCKPSSVVDKSRACSPPVIVRYPDLKLSGTSPYPPPIPWSLDSQVTNNLVCSGCGSNMWKPVDTSLSLPPWFSWESGKVSSVSGITGTSLEAISSKNI